jgi:hypothetical protein
LRPDTITHSKPAHRSAAGSPFRAE